jgi:hypothetical protein
MLVLHLHQHQSSRNLHLQYLAKNQSTQRCQSLITPGSDHTPVIEPHMVLTALQLRGEALMWWNHFKTMQQGCAVTWNDFKQAFKSHYIPKGLMDMKMRELLALRQGSDTVYRYAEKFYSLCQYGGHHVDTDAKKIERFCDGLDGKLYE